MYRFPLLVLVVLLSFSLAVAQTPSGTPSQSQPAAGQPEQGNAVSNAGTASTGTTPNPAATANAATSPTTPEAPAAAAVTPTIRATAGSDLPNAESTADPTDLTDLLSPGPLPKAKLSLIGGTVKSINQISDRMTLDIPGGKSMKVRFDQRTHFIRDGKETTQMAVKKGEKVYLDTQLADSRVFAKHVFIQTATGPADASGQIISADPARGEFTLRDTLSGTPVRFRLDQASTISNQGNAATKSDLKPGSLVSLKFQTAGKKDRAIAQAVNIIAQPGNSFTYYGQVTNLNLKDGVISVENKADGKTYDVRFDPAKTPIPDDLTVGSQVTITATFDGKDYTANTIQPTGPKTAGDTSENNPQ